MVRIAQGSLAYADGNHYVWVMADEPDNLTLRVLQEMREENRQAREEDRQAREEARSTAKDLVQRINGVTVLLTMLAGMVHDHDERLGKLETR